MPSVEEISPTVIAYLEKAQARLERQIKSAEAIVTEKEQVLIVKQQALTALSVNRKRKGAGARSSNRATTVQNYQAPESLLAGDVVTTRKGAERGVSAGKKRVEHRKQIGQTSG